MSSSSPAAPRSTVKLTATPAASGSRLTAAQLQAVTSLLSVPALADELGERFAAAGRALHLVGGSVRDALLGAVSDDLDFATDAPPEVVLQLVDDWAETTWKTGITFGTVGVFKRGMRLEITTYRTEAYVATSRQPEVRFGTSLAEDLSRRDFTVNAMAVAVPSHEFVDLYNGVRDLAARTLRTPGSAEQSFSDDPLRMLRAARFAASLGFTVAPEVVEVMSAMADRLHIISAERKRDELTKLICAADPRRGLALLVDTGLADAVLPELPKLRLTQDEHHRHKDVYEHTLIVLEQAIWLETDGPDLVLRLAALLHDIGKPKTRSFEPGGRVSFHHHEVVGRDMARARLSALHYPKAVVEDVARLVELHLRFHGYGGGKWTDAAVRRYVRDAGPLLDRLHALVRSDCTTRNKRKAAALARSYDALVERIDRLAAEEDLASLRPDLDGTEIMELLGLPPGRLVGAARSHLLALRMERGPMERDEAVAELRRWAADQGLDDVPPAPDVASD